MSNPNGSTPAGGQNPQHDQNGYPHNGFPQNGQPGYAQQGQAEGYPQQGQTLGYPQQGHPQQQRYPQGRPNPGDQQQWQQPEPPKSQNFLLRHKILTGLLALAVLIGLGSALSGGGKKDDAAKSTTSNTSGTAPASGGSTPSGTKSAESKASESKAAETKEALPAVGQPIKDGDFTFTVTQVERNVPSIGGSFMNKKAQGAYTLVHVTVKNTGTQTQSMSASDQKAYDANGIGYEATSDGAIYIEGNDTLYTEINPGNTLKGILVFDAPKGTKLTKVRLHDSMFSNGTEGSL